MNCLQPPSDNKTVNFIAGLSGPSSKWNPLPLTNLNDLWMKNLENLQSGDIMVCGGDFIQAASPDACFLQDGQVDPAKSLKVTAKEAASWNTGADYSKVCSTEEELNSCEHGAYQAEYSTTRTGTFPCICPCPDKLSSYPSNTDLLLACKDAMARGVKIVFMDDIFFLSDVYPDNKRGHDFVFVTLQHYSDTLSPADKSCKGGGFYWYMYGQQGRSIYNGAFLRTHAKVTSFYFIGPSHKDKYFSSIQGSFNPSYPISLTFETGCNVVGLLDNEFIKASAYFPFDELTHVISFAYTSDPSKGPRRYYTGLGPSPCPPSSEWTGSIVNTSANHCKIPPCCSTDHHGFLQPWFNIANALGIAGFSPNGGSPGQPPPPAAWWTKLNGTIWASSNPDTSGYYPVFGDDVFIKPITIPKLEFCGLDFTKIKYGMSLHEDRITFTDSNVVVKFGAAPSQLMGRYYYGLTLTNEILANAEKYVKVGLMQNLLDYPCVGEGCGGATNEQSTDIIEKQAGLWLLGPSTQLPASRDENGVTKYTPGAMMKLLRSGTPFYMFQKNQGAFETSDMCAFKCDSSSGKCTPTPPDPTKAFYNQNSCFDTLGNIDTSKPGCYASAAACGKACGGNSPTQTKEAYTKEPECNGADYQDYVSAWTTNGINTPDGDMLTPWLGGATEIPQTVGTYPNQKGVTVPVANLGAAYTGANGPRSKLQDGTLKPISTANPYPFFVGYYSQNQKKSGGLHWKFYMSEKSMLFSTHHPATMFYTNGYPQSKDDPGAIFKTTNVAMGYDIQWGNCSNLIAYYDQLYNWIWENSVWHFTGFYPDTALAKSLLPPLCSTPDCKVPGASAVPGDGSCYAGGLGANTAHTGGYKCTPGTGKWKDHNFCDVDNSKTPQFSSEAECMAASKNGCKAYTGGWKCASGTGKGKGSFYCDPDNSSNPQFKTYQDCMKDGCKTPVKPPTTPPPTTPPPTNPPSGFPWKSLARGLGIVLVVLAVAGTVWVLYKYLAKTPSRPQVGVDKGVGMPLGNVGVQRESIWNKMGDGFQSFKKSGGLKATAIVLASTLTLTIIFITVVALTSGGGSAKDYLMGIYPAMKKNAKKEDYDRLFDSLGQYLQCCQTNNTYLDGSGKLVGDAITGPSGEAPNKMRYIGGIERFPPDTNQTGAVPFYPPVWKGLPCCQGDYKIPRMPKGRFLDWYALQYFNVPVCDVNDKGWDFADRSEPADRRGFRSVSTLGSTSPGTNLFGTTGKTSKGKQAFITPADPTAVNQGVPFGQVAGPGAVYAGSSYLCRAPFSPNGPQFDPDTHQWTMSGMKNNGNNWLHQYVTLDAMKHATDFSNNKPWFNGFKEGEHFEIGHTQRVPGFPNSTGYWANYFGGGGTGQFLRVGKTPVVGADQVADMKNAFPSTVDSSIFKDLVGAAPRNKMHMLFTLLWQVRSAKTLSAKLPQGVTSGSDLLKFYYNTDDPWLITFWHANCAAPGKAGSGFTANYNTGTWNTKPQSQEWQDFKNGTRSFSDFALPSYPYGYAPYMVPLPEVATESQGETFVQPNKWGMAPDMYSFYFGGGSQGPTQKVSDRQVGAMILESIGKLGVYDVNTDGNISLTEDLYGKWNQDNKLNGTNYATLCAFLLQAEFGNVPGLTKYVTPPQWLADSDLAYGYFMNTTPASLDPNDPAYAGFLHQFPKKGKPGIGALTYEGVKYSLAKAFMSNWLYDRAGNGVNWDEPMNYFGQVLNYEVLQMPCNTNLTGFWSFELIHIRNPDAAFEKWNKDMNMTLPDGVLDWKQTITSERKWPYISNGSAGAVDQGNTPNYSAPAVVIFNSLLASSLTQRDPFDINNDSKATTCNSIAGFKCDSIPGVTCIEQSEMVWSKDKGTLQSWMKDPNSINYAKGKCTIDLDKWPGYAVGTTDGVADNVVIDNNGMCHVPWAGPCTQPTSAIGTASFGCPQFQGGGFEMMGSSYCQTAGADKPSLPSIWSNMPMNGHAMGDSIVTPRLK